MAVEASATLRGVCQFSSGPLKVDFVAGEYVEIAHGLGRQPGYLVVGASGPLMVWEVPSGDPYNVLRLQANQTMTGVRIALV